VPGAALLDGGGDQAAGTAQLGDLGVDAVEDNFEPPTLGLAGGVAVVGGVERVDDFVEGEPSCWRRRARRIRSTVAEV
jgi:hypothetical protein